MLNYVPNRFDGKTVLVTGGTSGIGRAVCIRAGLEGAKVVVAGRSEERGRSVVDEIERNGGKAIFVATDVTNEEAVINLVRKSVEAFGELNVAVNNAGIVGKGERFDQLSTEQWLEVVNTNLLSAFFSCREESRVMIEQGGGGSIVNVSSVAGVTGVFNSAAYVASKHGLNGLTKAVAIDMAPFNIRCNSVNPASTDTPLTQKVAEDVKKQIEKSIASGLTPEQARASSMIGGKTQTLQKRNATPEQQAATILYVASDDAQHITGSIIVSDGGYTAY